MPARPCWMRCSTTWPQSGELVRRGDRIGLPTGPELSNRQRSMLDDAGRRSLRRRADAADVEGVRRAARLLAERPGSRRASRRRRGAVGSVVAAAHDGSSGARVAATAAGRAFRANRRRPRSAKFANSGASRGNTPCRFLSFSTSARSRRAPATSVRRARALSMPVERGDHVKSAGPTKTCDCCRRWNECSTCREVVRICAQFGRATVTDWVREVLGDMRNGQSGELAGDAADVEGHVVERLGEVARKRGVAAAAQSHQRHRHRDSHESRPGAARAGGDRGDDRGRGLHQPGSRSCRPASAAGAARASKLFARKSPARGGARREQLCRRHAAHVANAGRRPARHHLSRPAHRDRRLVSLARRVPAGGRRAARSRHDESHAACRITPTPSARKPRRCCASIPATIASRDSANR